MFLWLDDIRPAPQGWFWVKTADEAAEALLNNEVLICSFDHDLGEASYCEPSIGNGMDLVNFMKDKLPPSKWPNSINIHSANNIAADRMKDVLRNFAPRFVEIMRMEFSESCVNSLIELTKHFMGK